MEGSSRGTQPPCLPVQDVMWPLAHSELRRGHGRAKQNLCLVLDTKEMLIYQSLEQKADRKRHNDLELKCAQENKP